jgi:hypothetical protein
VNASNQWKVAAAYEFVKPVGSLSKWFKPASTYYLSVGKQTSEYLLVEAKTDIIFYRRENEDDLYYSNIDLELEIYGLCVQANYDLLRTDNRFVPTLIGGIGLYRWFGNRGEYMLPEVIVPARSQQDWSWGFQIGAGVDFFIARNIALSINGYYQLIVGELWPALALRLENVSGFQSLNGAIGLTVFF